MTARNLPDSARRSIRLLDRWIKESAKLKQPKRVRIPDMKIRLRIPDQSKKASG